MTETVSRALPGPSARLRRNPVAVASIAVLCLMVLIAAAGPLVSRYTYDTEDRAAVLAPASSRHWLGTDNHGQDTLTRLMHGARVSLTVGLVVEAIEVLIGVALGLLAAWKGGRLDTLLMRITDGMFAFPDLLFAILLVGIMRPTTAAGSFLTVFVALALVNWPGMARLVRGQALAVREKEYVEAARALGITDWRIVTRHVLPNIMSPIIVAATEDIAQVILAEATLSFLGIGIQPPYPSWGRMISDGLPYLRSAPQLIVYPAAMLGIVVLSLNFLGDALRDALDPRMRR